MDIAELVAAADAAGELGGESTVQVTAEQAQTLNERLDPLGASVTAEERQAMLERNGLASPAPVETPVVVAPVAVPTAIPATPSIPAPVAVQPAGPTPEQLALQAQTRGVLETMRAIKDEIVSSRKPPEKRYEDMDEVEKLRYDLKKEARQEMDRDLSELKSQHQQLVAQLREANQRAQDNEAAHQFQGQVGQQVSATMLRPELVDPEFVSAALRKNMTELGLTAAAGYREDAVAATRRIQGMFNDYITALNKTAAKRVAPQMQRAATLPPVVATGQPAVGIPRKPATNQDVAKYYNGDRFAASRDNYRKVPAAG